MSTVFNKCICFLVSMPRNSGSKATGATPVVQTLLPSFKETFSQAGTTLKLSGATEMPKCKDFITFSPNNSFVFVLQATLIGKY